MSVEGIIGVVTALVALCSAVVTSPCWAPLFSRDTHTTELLKNKIQNLGLQIKDIKGKRKRETGVFIKEVSNLIAESDVLLDQLNESKIVELEGKIDKKCMSGFVPHLCIQKQAQSEMEEQWIPKLKIQSQKAESILLKPYLCRGHKHLCMVDIEGKKRKEAKENIWKMISSSEKPHVICIHGVLGVGKTTMAKSIHNKALDDENEELFCYVVWVEVGYGMDVHGVQDCIAKSLDIEYSAEEERNKTLENVLSKMNNFLLVLDSVWEPISLKDIGVPELVGRRNVIVTSRISTVCDQMGERVEKFEVQPLPCEEEAWELFKKEMAGARLFLEEMVVKKNLMSELDGLPLAINKYALALGNTTVEDEQINIACVKDIRLGKKPFYLQGTDQEFCNHFTRSYCFLDEKSKPCFMYCALFPKGHLINAKELIEYWIWEGLVGEAKDTETTDEKRMSLEEGRTAGKKMLRELQNAHLLQRVGSGADEKVKMLSSFRAMAIETMAKEGKTVCIRSGDGLTCVPSSGRDWNSDVERASFMNNKLKVLNLNGNKNCSQLFTLFLQHNPLESDGINQKFFGSMCNLRVLNLSQTTISSLPKSFSKLKNLRALIMRSCSNLTTLPDLSELQQLIVLDLCGTSLKHCPPGIIMMKKLRRIDLSDTRIESFPADIVVNLKELEELLMITNCNCVWKSTEDEQEVEGPFIEDLFKLNKLAVLEIHLGNACALFKFVCYVADYANLPLRFRFLAGDVHRGGGGGSYVEENLLRVSGIDIYKTSLKWELNVILYKLSTDLNILDVSNLSGLSYLFPAEILESITNLRELRVTRCDDVVELIQKPSQESTFVCLPKLSRMVLFDLPRLKSICCGQVLNCPNLLYIEVWGCQKLKLPMIKYDPTYQGSNPRLKIHIKAERSWWFGKLEWDNSRNSNPVFGGSPRSHPNFTFFEAQEPPEMPPRPNARNDPQEEEEEEGKTHNTAMARLIGRLGMVWARRNVNAPSSLLMGPTPSNGTNYSEIEIGEQRSRLDNPENSNSLVQDTTPLLNSSLILVETPVPPKLDATTS